MRIRVDGATLPRPDPASAGVYHFAELGTVRLRPREHSLSLVAPGIGAVAYILAISLERVGQAGSGVAVCVAGRRALLGTGQARRGAAGAADRRLRRPGGAARPHRPAVPVPLSPLRAN